MKIIENNILPPKGYSAIMLLGVIFVRPGTVLSLQTIQHEWIHKQQMIEMFIIFFYLWYAIEFLIRLSIYRNRRKAYYSISFEREAYANDEVIGYRRKRFAWVKYLK